MLVRLILTLLLAAFAVPAAATGGCHEAAAASTRHGMPADHHRAPDPALAAHSCIGCIPPGDWVGARVAVRFSAPPLPRAIEQQPFASGRAVLPALPPPRAA